MACLNDPQETIPIIHVAGTSGKGSTAYSIAKLLHAHGYKVGLHLSPHILDIRERFQLFEKKINWRQRSKKWAQEATWFFDKKLLMQAQESFPPIPSLHRLIKNKLQPAIILCNESIHGMPSYFEICIALAYSFFAQQQVDVAVIEAWCGGTFDGTNVVTNKDKICIITKQWLDHEHILWETIEEITNNDAGIIHPGNTVVSLFHAQQICREIIEKKCAEQNAELHFLTPTTIPLDNFKTKPVGADGRLPNQTFFHYIQTEQQGGYPESIFSYNNHTLTTSLLWSYQAENISLALKATELFLAKRQKQIDREIVQSTLTHLHFLGRFDIHHNDDQTVIYDGAHNPQKMNEFIQSLNHYYPHHHKHFLLSFKEWKKVDQMLDLIIPHGTSITTCNYEANQEFSLSSYPEAYYKHYMTDKNFPHRQHISDPVKALEKMTQDTWVEESQELIVVTWSLYLLSHLYRSHRHSREDGNP